MSKFIQGASFISILLFLQCLSVIRSEVDPAKLQTAREKCLKDTSVTLDQYLAAMDCLDPDGVSHEIKCITRCAMEDLQIINMDGSFPHNPLTEPYMKCLPLTESDLCERAWAFHICVSKIKKGLAK